MSRARLAQGVRAFHGQAQLYVCVAAMRGASPPPRVFTPQTPSLDPHASMGLQSLAAKHWRYISHLGMSLAFWVMQSGQLDGMLARHPEASPLTMALF